MPVAAQPPAGGRRAWWTLSLLSLLYVLSFVDRLILALLVAPLKADLGVSDVQLGLLFGPAFAIFYAVLGLPIARLADRGNRKALVTAGVLLWGAATVGSGFAGTFWVLVVLRVGLAVGEAALTPSAFSMIGDLFPAQRRAFAASVYSAMGMAGGSAAYIVGALVVHLAGQATNSGVAPAFSVWQLVLIIVGAPSLVVGLLFAITVREPVRSSPGAAAPKMSEVAGYLRRHARLFGGLFAGAGLTQAIGYAYSAWGPELLRRQYDWSIQQAGLALGLCGLFAGFGGTLAAPFVARALERRGRADGVALTSMGGVCLGATMAAAAPLQRDPMAFLVLQALSGFCLIGGANNVIVALQTLAPARMRATFVALLLTCITLLGLGVGPTAAAMLSTHLNPDGKSLGPALAILAPMIAIPAFLLLLWSRGGLRPPILDEESAGEGAA